MFNQSITGIRSNLDAFAEAAARIAQPQATEIQAGRPDEQAKQSTGPRLAITPADQTAGSPPNKTSTNQPPKRAHNFDAPKETANDPGTRSKSSDSFDPAQEAVKMMVAQKCVQANLSVLRTASSLSGQGLDILA